MQGALVQLKQEHDQNKQGVEHEEEEDGFVAEFLQIGGDTSLLEINVSTEIV